MKVEPNNGGADVFDFVEVILAGVSKTLGTIGGSTPTTAEIVYDGLASLNFNVNVLWHHKTWGDAAGRWTTQSFAVTEAELCPAPPVSEYCLYQDPQTIKGGKNIALTWETVANGNVVITMSNGTGTTSCSFRNGGFEGGIGAFIVSTDDFVTSEAASNYFTATQVYSGNTYTLTKIADLPDNAKIKHVGSGHALAWVLDGNNEHCYPDFIYTYGGICNEEPELTSIEMSSSTAIAQVGAGITITASPLDQFGAPIEATINYEISPSDAGEIVGNVFTFAKLGAATITARSGDVQNSIALYCVSSDNLALNKDCEGGFYDGNPGETAAKANDGADNTAWVTYANQPASVEWWYVDLGNLYNITAISALWGNDYSTNYILQVRTVAPEEADKADDEAWTTIATVTNASAGNIALNYVTAQGRYVRIHSLNRSGDCIRLRELQVFGSEAVTPTKSVSAAVNDPAMGTATVKQNGDPVTEVETGSTVTFSAVANDGYIFVDWSNGNTNATFNAIVDAAMNLTANFRALGNIYCNTEMTASDHTVYVTMKRSDVNEYTLTVRSAEELSNFGGTVFYRPENILVKNVRNEGVLSDGNHTLSVTMESEGEPYFGTPLYVVFAGVGEVTYSQMQNVRPEYAVACDDAVSVTSITLSQTSANLLVGHTLTLTPTFTPAYATDRAITWETSDASVATVNNGEVTAVAEGNATITAKLTSDNSIYATCDVHVIASLTEATWHGYAIATTPTEGNILLTYSVTRDVDQHLTFSLTTDKNMVGFVTFINIAGAAHELTGYGAGYTATYTTTDTYEDNVSLNCMWDVRGAGYGHNFNFTYMVGSENDPLKTLALSETQDNTSVLAALNGQEVAIAIVNRSFTAGNLYTLVLPFDVDAAQTAAKLPGHLTKLQNTIVKENQDLRINFVDVSEIEAGVPYLYEPSAAVANPTFESVEVSATLNPTVADSYAKYYGIYAPMDGGALHALTNAYVLGPDQYLYAVSDLPATQTMGALRGYFVLNFPSGSSGMPRARVIFNSHETETATGVESIQPSDVNYQKVLRDGQILIIREGKTYNAQGQLIK